MSSPKLRNILSTLHQRLSEKEMPHALIGAMALSLYGMPRYTADIDLLSDIRQRKALLRIMGDMGFDCFQDSDNFLQFDSEMGVYGKIDFMLVHTDEGRAVLERAILVQDESFGVVPVVQPTDYVVLKLMAIANNPDRKNRDTGDLESLFKAVAAGFVNPVFSPIDVAQLQIFAARFGVLDHLEMLLPLLEDICYR